MKPYLKTDDLFDGYENLRNRAIIWANVPTLVEGDCGLKLILNTLSNISEDQILEFESEKDKLTFILKYA